MSEGELEEDEKESGSSKVLYKQLQSEYNELLKRYARAENTIDELRTGATVHLYTDSQNAKPNSCGETESVRHSQRIDFPRPLLATVGVSGTTDTGMKPAGSHDLAPKRNLAEEQTIQRTRLPNNEQDNDSPARRIQSLKDNVDSLETYLTESDLTPTSLNEVSAICKQLDKDHKELCRELKNIKQSQRPSSQSSEASYFASKSGLEKELYRIELRIEDIQQEVAKRLKANKAGDFNPHQKTEEQVERRFITSTCKPTRQISSASSLPVDPGLTNLVKKLRDLHDAGIRTSEEILNSSREADRLKVPSGDVLLRDGTTRGHSSSSSESHDVVDARYLAASPVHMEHDHGNEEYVNGVDHMVHDDEAASEKAVDTVGGTRSSGLSNHLCPPQSKRSSSSKASRDRAGSLAFSKRPMNPYHQRSLSTEDCRNGRNSRPQSPLSDPVHKNRPHQYSAPHTAEGLPHEHLHQNKEYSSSPVMKNTRKSNSMSSLVDSSRMSTPLFHPRGATRVTPHEQRGMKYKRRNPSDGCDSGFVGSEESRGSRMTTESPDLMRKLNFSNQWDSNLHLDLVSEIDENDSASSPEQLSTTYEPVTETVRRSRSPGVLDRAPCDTGESTLVNSSPSPPSSPDRGLRKPAKYFGYRTSRTGNKQSSGESSLPVSQTEMALSSRGSERPSSARSPRVERTSGANRVMKETTVESRRPGSRESPPNFAVGHRVLTGRRSPENIAEREINDDKNERESLLALRNEIDQLRDLIKSKINQPNVTLGMYEDLRRLDDESRNALERKNDRKLDDLRRSVDHLTKNLHLRRTSERHRSENTGDTNSYDDLRNQVKNLTEKLGELSQLQTFPRGPPLSSGAPKVTLGDEVGDRFADLLRKVDELRLKVENDVPRERERPHQYFCRLCNEGGLHHHGYHVITERKPRTSTPLVSEVYHTRSQRHSPEPEIRSGFQSLSSTYPGAQSQSPVIHHIHTYHRSPRIKKEYETDSSSDEAHSQKRTKHRKPSLRRTQVIRGSDDHRLYLPLAEASHAARNVQRLSKNILNSISLDLTSLRS